MLVTRAGTDAIPTLLHRAREKMWSSLWCLTITRTILVQSRGVNGEFDVCPLWGKSDPVQVAR